MLSLARAPATDPNDAPAPDTSPVTVCESAAVPVLDPALRGPAGSLAPAFLTDETDPAYLPLVQGVLALPWGTRAELLELSLAVDRCLQLGRLVRLVPLVFVLGWPVALHMLITAWRRARALLQDDAVRALVEQARPVSRRAWMERAGGDASGTFGGPEHPVTALLNLREAGGILAVGTLGPPVILAGFVLAFLVAGR